MMNFRVLATIPRRSENGNAYRHTIWMGEFDQIECSEEEAQEYAKERIRQKDPDFTGYSLELEIVQPRSFCNS